MMEIQEPKFITFPSINDASHKAINYTVQFYAPKQILFSSQSTITQTFWT